MASEVPEDIPTTNPFDTPTTTDIVETQWEQEEEYETDSEESSSESCDGMDENFLPTRDEMAMMRLHEQTKSRSGKTLRASVRLDL